MGEDTHLVAKLGHAAITGFTNNKNFTSQKAVAPLMKHYAAYSAPEGAHTHALSRMTQLVVCRGAQHSSSSYRSSRAAHYFCASVHSRNGSRGPSRDGKSKLREHTGYTIKSVD